MFFKTITVHMLVFLAFATMPNLEAQTTTNDIALKMHYYDYVRNLRNKSTDHIRTLESLLKSRTDELRSEHHSQVADERDQEYRGATSHIQDKFDKAFEALDQQLLFYGDTLDNNNASAAEKQRFIQNNQDALTRAINQIIQQSSPQTLR